MGTYAIFHLGIIMNIRERAFSMLRLCIVTILSAASVAAADIPFWGDETPPTNRVCASSASVAPTAGFDSRLASTGRTGLEFFDSFKVGFLLFLR